MTDPAGGSDAAVRAARNRRRSATAGFDRLRPHQPVGPRSGTELALTTVGRDAHGKRALYSGTRPPPPPTAGVVVLCSRCRRVSTVGLGRALRVLTPSMHIPVLRSRYPSLLRCPTCHKVSWVRIRLRIRPLNRPS